MNSLQDAREYVRTIMATPYYNYCLGKSQGYIGSYTPDYYYNRFLCLLNNITHIQAIEKEIG